MEDRNAPSDTPHAPLIERRQVLKAGAGLLAAPLLGRATPPSATPDNQVGNGPYTTRAYGSSGRGAKFRAVNITRRALGPKDVLVDVLYASICHSDIHAVNGDWGPSADLTVPGHEIVGRVIAVGAEVRKFRVGDIAGVGCMVDSCGTCPQCLADREQSCATGTTFTYGSPDRVSGGVTYGGYSDCIVVTEKFAIRIPPGMDLAATAPILCAGITTFSPMQHWRLEPGQRVGIVGLGGLGHMAVKLGVARKADVVVFTTTPDKTKDAVRLGAKEGVLWSDDAAMRRLGSSLDLIISTVPKAYPMQPFLNLLKIDGTFVNVGALGELEAGISGMQLAFSRRSLAGSMIGGLAETQQVIDYCYTHNIKADIELIKPDEIDRAYERVVNKEARYRFVIDFATAKGVSR